MHEHRDTLARHRILVGVACAAGVAFAAASAALHAQPLLPPEQTEGEVRYRVGGIGVDEADAMRQAAPQYPVMLTFVERIGEKSAFTADVDVSIRGSDGTQIETTAAAPLMLIDLPPGSYEVTATQHGQTRTQQVSVEDGQARNYVFSWQAKPADQAEHAAITGGERTAS